MQENAAALSRQEQEAPSTEAERPKTELRLVRDDEAPAMIDRMVEEFKETADTKTQEAKQDDAALLDFAGKQGDMLNADEANDNASINARVEAATTRFNDEVAAVTAPEAPVAAAPVEAKAEPVRDLAAVEADYRSLNEQAEAAYKKGDKGTVETLTARLAEVKAERSRMEAAAKEAAPAAAKKEEAKVIPDFGQLLEHLSPEAQKMAADNYANADETSYGGMVSKGMSPDGVVRIGYKDGTIVETFPGGQQRSNRPEAAGAERIPSLPDYLQQAEPMGEDGEQDPELAALEEELKKREGKVPLSTEEHRDIMQAALLVLENDTAMDKDEMERLRGLPKSPENDEQIAKLEYRMKFAGLVIDKKNTPPHLQAEIFKLEDEMAKEKAALETAPAEERDMHLERIKQYEEQKDELEGRLEEAAKESPPEKEKNALEEMQKEMKLKRRLELEASMRDLEGKYKATDSPDEKAAIARQLETATAEWDRLMRESGAKGTGEAVADAAALVGAAETIKELGNKKEEELSDEEKQKLEDAKKTAAKKSPTSKMASVPQEKEGYEGGGGGGGDKSDVLKDVGEEWMYWEKLLGGWAKKG